MDLSVIHVDIAKKITNTILDSGSKSESFSRMTKPKVDSTSCENMAQLRGKGKYVSI